MSRSLLVFSRWISLLLASWGLGGCLSGQTGSPDCVGVTSCICDPLYAGGLQLRVHAESVEPGKLVAVIDGILSPADQAYDLQLGDRVGGALLAETPCATGSLGLVAGDDLVVHYIPGVEGGYPNCSEFQACAGADCEGLPQAELPACWDECQTQTREACADHRQAALLDGVISWAVPFADELSFGHNVTLSSSEIGVLDDVDSCLEHFPPPPPPPCEDTRYGCAVAANAAEGGSPWPIALLGLAALAYGSRRLLRR